MDKWKLILRKSAFIALIISSTLCAGYLIFSRFPIFPQSKTNLSDASNEENGQQVLGRFDKTSQIFIYGSSESNYVSGGVIALASTDEPSVQIGGYNISGNAEITMYKANKDSLLSYLIHDKDGEQINKTIDTGQFSLVTKVNQDLNLNSGNVNKITLPFDETGIWYLKVKIGSVDAGAFVIRSDTGIITDQGDNQLVFWGQNYKTKRSIDGGNVSLINLNDKINILQSASFNSEGIAYLSVSADADIALIEKDTDIAIIPLNLKHLNYGYSYKEFQPTTKDAKYFLFTDRPIYKPGDTIYFKAILRDDDDARYTIPGGSIEARVYDGDYNSNERVPLFSNMYSISGNGTINGQYKIPENANVGYYSLEIGKVGADGKWESNEYSYFDVEFYQKPEFSIDIATPQTEFIEGDDITFIINGTYFSGQPLTNQTVKYTVYASDFFEYSYLSDHKYFSNDLSDDYRYGYWYGAQKVSEGTASLDKQGKAQINIDSKIDFNEGKSQVFSIEASLEDNSIASSFARRNVLVYAGEYGIYRKDASFGAKVGESFSLPVTIIPYKENVKVSGINLTAKVHRENWVATQEPNKKYPTYKKEEEDLQALSAKTDNNGSATFSFIPSKVGSYTYTVEGTDVRGNAISKIFYLWVSSEDYSYSIDSSQAEITLTLDKQKYLPSDTVHFNLFSTVPDRDIFLAIERGRLQRFQIVHLNGKRGTFDVPLVSTDMPNVFAVAYSFSSHELDSTSVKIPVSPDSKKVLVNIIPGSEKYGPGETATINLSTTDYAGNPISADLAFWVVDKSIFELAEDNLGNIFDTYWSERWNSTSMAHSLEGISVEQSEMGGCFAKGTPILTRKGSVENIENIKVGDSILTRSEESSKLVKAKVTGVHSAQVDGYLIINGNLKITTNHILRVNESWKEAGNVTVGDYLIDDNGNDVLVTSLEWQRGKFEVFNLEVERYHTFFAGGVWVHNQKGDSRTTFKDTAYWNPSIQTDSAGHAQVIFKLPDNLTTWTLAAVADTPDTKVGQKTAEIVVTKDLIVRPILPNILRVGDTIVLSALVQNFTQQDQTFDINFQFDSGDVEQSLFEKVEIKAGEMQQMYWNVQPTKENKKAKLTFSAKSNENKKLSDTIVAEIPVKPLGFAEKSAESGDGDKIYKIELAEDNDIENSSVALSVSPTIIGTLPVAMKYLINYPYGCVEQTTSRFVPAVIAKLNPSLFKDALAGKDINDIIDKGITRLSKLQNEDGGWSWWSTGNSDPFITAYVIEYLLQAKNSGTIVEEDVLRDAKTFLEKDQFYNPLTKQNENYGREDRIAKNYGLVLLGDVTKVQKVTDYKDLSPDLLAINVMTNYLLGDKNPASNGLNELISQAQTQGDALYWKGGRKTNFGVIDTSTALAIRAMVTAEAERQTITKAVTYLTRNRQADYWGNTFATAQIVRALTDFSKTGSDTTPNYSYNVLLDGKQIAQGNVATPNQNIKDISIPVKQIKPEGSEISLIKKGEGQMYSTLIVDSFHTNKNSPAVSHGITIKREYVNEKGPEYSIAVGDMVKVNLTISGLTSNEYYGVIKDELPSGMVPVNESLKNSQYGQDERNSYSYWSVEDRDTTENGTVLSLYSIEPGARTYSYRARVVSEGTFYAPPATVELMYAPEINGRTSAQTVQIGKVSVFTPIKLISKVASSKVIMFIIVGIILVAGGISFFILKRRGIILKKKNIPPKETPPKPIQKPPISQPSTPAAPPVPPAPPQL